MEVKLLLLEKKKKKHFRIVLILQQQKLLIKEKRQFHVIQFTVEDCQGLDANHDHQMVIYILMTNFIVRKMLADL